LLTTIVDKLDAVLTLQTQIRQYNTARVIQFFKNRQQQLKELDTQLVELVKAETKDYSKIIEVANHANQLKNNTNQYREKFTQNPSDISFTCNN
jgi:Spy/CpxP family protein refolding chaperone